MRSLIQMISLDPSKCSGCTNCIKRCPSSAIRVKDGKAKIIESRCINCGACMTICPSNAFFGVTHDLDYIFDFPHRVALVDPVLYSQFNTIFGPSQINDCIYQLGFNDIYEITKATNHISKFTQKYILQAKKLPIISSSCPAILRLIQLRFHNLIDHIIPIDSPVEIAAYMARSMAMSKYNLAHNDIGIFYISPCTARISSFKKPIGTKKTHVDGALSMKSIFLKISKIIGNSTGENNNYSTHRGFEWARVEGQSKALNIKEYLAVDGIDNVIDVLEEIENNKITKLLFLECQACTNGCIGGNLTVENSFVAKNRIRQLNETYSKSYTDDLDFPSDEFVFTETINPLYSAKLDADLSRAIEKLIAIEKILKDLPQIDCGACGSPSCRALAEDIILGYAKEEDCMVNIKKIYYDSLINNAKNKDKG